MGWTKGWFQNSQEDTVYDKIRPTNEAKILSTTFSTEG